MDDVAAEAGVTKATVYYHFASKEALYTSICVEHAARSMQHVEQIVSSQLTATEKLIELVWNLVASTIHEPTSRLLYDVHARITPESRDVIRTAQHRYVDAMARELAAAQAAGEAFPGDPKVMALAAFESIGRTRHWFDPRGRLNAEEGGATIARMFLRGLLKPPAPDLFDERLKAGAEGFFPTRFDLVGSGGGTSSNG